VSIFGPFTRHGRVLSTRPDVSFRCPLSNETVAWAAKDVFNPGAVVADGKVCLLVRAEDTVGPWLGTSRLGLATSEDGLDFELETEPVLFPADDAWQALEWPGGCEDPRVVESPDGRYACTYTAFDGRVGRLMVATSPDLRHWEKHGPAFAGTPYAERWSKSGSVVTELCDGNLVAARIDGRFWMLWGERTVYAASSDDLVAWRPVEFDPGADRYLTLDDGGWRVHHTPGHPVLRPVLTARRGRFDSLLTEPGPPPVLSADGIEFIYNGVNHPSRGVADSPPHAYQPGLVVLDPADPTAVVHRSTEPLIRVGADEAQGQVGNVLFAQGLVLHRDRWMLYYGMGDSSIGCASAPVAGSLSRRALSGHH
jgi:predicted GH43/DUF377 family glycosyl hydrolase